MTTRDAPATPADLAGFRRSQRLAYACAMHVETQLYAGITEAQTAVLMRRYLTEHGVGHYFHTPFVWFGDRTELSVDWSDAEFLPTSRALVSGMPVILDVAPIVDGFAADIGYAFAFGPNPRVDAMLADLEAYRSLIPRCLREGRTLQEIYCQLDDMIAAQGYQSSHHAYPAGVIGHRVAKLAPVPDDEAAAGGFGISAFNYLKDHKILSAKDPLVSPYWNGTKHSAHAPQVGLWAVEPHIARGGIGVKFEELLVVTEHDAYWLDEDLPHVERWRRAKPAAVAKRAEHSPSGYVRP